MYIVNLFPTQCTKWTYFLHNAQSEPISYTMYKVYLFPTQRTKWTYFLHNVQSELISYAMYKVNLFPILKHLYLNPFFVFSAIPYWGKE